MKLQLLSRTHCCLELSYRIVLTTVAYIHHLKLFCLNAVSDAFFFKESEFKNFGFLKCLRTKHWV